MALNPVVVETLKRELLLHLARASDGSALAIPGGWKQALITYGDLVKRSRLNIPAKGIGRHLSQIGEGCGKLPRLDALVINRKTGKPSRRFGDDKQWCDLVTACIRQAASYN